MFWMNDDGILSWENLFDMGRNKVHKLFSLQSVTRGHRMLCF